MDGGLNLPFAQYRVSSSLTLDADKNMTNKTSINPVFIGRLSLGIIAAGLIYLIFILKQDGYNGLDGTNTEERLFLSLISVGGIIGIISYSKKKTACSAMSAIIFIMVMISTLTMYLNKPSNQSSEPTLKTPGDSVDV